MKIFSDENITSTCNIASFLTLFAVILDVPFDTYTITAIFGLSLGFMVLNGIKLSVYKKNDHDCKKESNRR